MPEITLSTQGMDIEMFSVTAIYIALNALIMLGLAYMVVRARQANAKSGMTLTEARDNWIRAHANNTEYVPIALLLMASVEFLGGPLWFLHGAGILLTVSRLLHGYGRGIADGANFGRFYGTLGTWIMILVSALAVLFLSIF